MVDKLRIQNFRAIEDLTIELSPGLTVLVGKNGCGKSTILDALSFAITTWTAEMRDVADGDSTTDRDVRIVTRRTAAPPRIGTRAVRDRSYPLRVQASLTVGPDRQMWTREISRLGAKPETVEGSTTVVSAIDHARRRAPRDTLRPEQTLPILAYYRTDRLSGWVDRIAAEAPSDPTFRLAGYEDGLHASLGDGGLRDWFEWRERDRVQRLGLAIQDGGSLPDAFDDSAIDAVSAAIRAALEGAKGMYYSFGDAELVVEMENGEQVAFDQLSDGQKNLAALMADVARRALQLNPHLGADAPRETSGWVLIDEVDLHLHPAWQRRVLGDLQHAFPKINFVVTTHSPQVLSSVASDSIRLIERTAEGHRVITPPVSVQGRDTNAILEDLLGVPARPAEFKARLEHAAQLIEDEQLEAARREVNALEHDLHDDPDVMGLRWELERAEDAAHPQGK